jgi:outer membrane murein-binding lipoprotein Lpp
VRSKKALVLGLAMVIVLSGLVVAGCGGSDEEAKEALRTALEKINTQVAELTTTFTAGGTVADVKAAKDRLATDWEAVVTAAEGVEGADVEAAKTAWTNVANAIDGLSDDVPLVEAAATIMGPVQALMGVVGELGELAGTGEE